MTPIPPVRPSAAGRLALLLGGLPWGILPLGCTPAAAPPAAENRAAENSAAERATAAPLFPAGGRLLDLTHPFDETTLYWPTDTEGFRLLRGEAGYTERGYFYAANRFAAAEHGGTHLDAPIHFFEGRQTTEEIPLERLLGPAVVIDVSAECAENPVFEIGVAQLRAWEERHGRQLVEVMVLLRTGWTGRWPHRETYLGTARRGPEAVAELRFPGLAPEAARWLAEHRAPLAVGIDTASIDHGPSRDFGSHVALFERNIPALENLRLPAELPPHGFTLLALPLKITGGSGGPVRAVAWLPE